MISYSVYKLLHLIGVFMVLLALGSTLAAAAAGSGGQSGWRKFGGMTSGIGLLIVLIAGFGLLARLGIGFPVWVVLKLLVWLALGLMLTFSRRSPGSARALWWLTLALAALAAYLGHFKPLQ